MQMHCSEVGYKVVQIYLIILALGTQLAMAKLLSLRHQQQVCLRRHTQRHGVMSSLQCICMKHAHSGTHAVCLLFFFFFFPHHQEMRGMTCPDKGAGECTLVCQCFGLLSPRVSCVSSHLFTYCFSNAVITSHYLLLAHSLCCVQVLCICTDYKEKLNPQRCLVLCTIECSCAILRERRKLPPSWHSKLWMIDRVI